MSSDIKNKLIKIIGWVGSAAFSICAVPQVMDTLETGINPISFGMMFLWTLGEICTLCYVILTVGFDKPLMMNYIVNLVCISILWMF